MAQEAELNAHGLVIDRLERFAALVAAHEREECAKVCEDASGTGKIISCISAAAAIRARGKK
jgi:DNA-binding sugar fermentation-stimulating protein